MATIPTPAVRRLLRARPRGDIGQGPWPPPGPAVFLQDTRKPLCEWDLRAIWGVPLPYCSPFSLCSFCSRGPGRRAVCAYSVCSCAPWCKGGSRAREPFSNNWVLFHQNEGAGYWGYTWGVLTSQRATSKLSYSTGSTPLPPLPASRWLRPLCQARAKSRE